MKTSSVDSAVQLEWVPDDIFEGRRWCATVDHGTYWVYEYHVKGHWYINFNGVMLACARDLPTSLAFAEWHNDYHKGTYNGS